MQIPGFSKQKPGIFFIQDAIARILFTLVQLMLIVDIKIQSRQFGNIGIIVNDAEAAAGVAEEE